MRPIWDIVLLPLLAGVTAVCVSGTWMALKRLRHDYRRVRRAFGALPRRLFRAAFNVD